MKLRPSFIMSKTGTALFSTLTVFALLLISLPRPVVEAGQGSGVPELDQLVSPSEKDFLLAELARIQPPVRIRDLAGYSQRQSDLGGGFYGMMPDQLADPDSIPVPKDEESLLAAAVCLARPADQITATELIEIGFQMIDESGGRQSRPCSARKFVA